MFCHVGILVSISAIVHAFYPYTPSLGRELDYEALANTAPTSSAQVQRRDTIEKVCVEAFSGLSTSQANRKIITVLH